MHILWEGGIHFMNPLNPATQTHREIVRKLLEIRKQKIFRRGFFLT